jgi:hypothetical protein
LIPSRYLTILSFASSDISAKTSEPSLKSIYKAL